MLALPRTTVVQACLNNGHRLVNNVHRGGKMFKPLIMLVRARAFAIAEAVADHNALVILDQQMREARPI